MKIVVRRKTFETNSSSTHSVTITKSNRDVRKVVDNLEKLLFLICQEPHLEEKIIDVYLEIDGGNRQEILDVCKRFKENGFCPVCKRAHPFVSPARDSLRPVDYRFPCDYQKGMEEMDEQFLEICKAYFKDEYQIFVLSDDSVRISSKNGVYDFSVQDDEDIFHALHSTAGYYVKYGARREIYNLLLELYNTNDDDNELYYTLEEIEGLDFESLKDIEKVFGKTKSNRKKNKLVTEIVRLSKLCESGIEAKLQEIVLDEYCSCFEKNRQEVLEQINHLYEIMNHPLCFNLFDKSNENDCESCNFVLMWGKVDLYDEEKVRKFVRRFFTHNNCIYTDEKYC